jgi:hypothetical protein
MLFLYSGLSEVSPIILSHAITAENFSEAQNSVNTCINLVLSYNIAKAVNPPRVVK